MQLNSCSALKKMIRNYQGMVDFGEKAASGFKITGIAGWQDDCNWGTDSSAAAPEAEAFNCPID